MLGANSTVRVCQKSAIQIRVRDSGGELVDDGMQSIYVELTGPAIIGMVGLLRIPWKICGAENCLPWTVIYHEYIKMIHGE